MAIIGPNGAGKSTLLLHLNGILRGEGPIRIFGLPLEERTLREIRRKVGVVFQDPDDQLFLTSVAQDVAFGPSNMGLSKPEIEERVREALAAVGMSGFQDRSTHLLSFGEKKRVATATVLAMWPDILVLDEPTSNLDPKARRQLINILANLPVTKIIVTHDLPVAYEMCNRAIILSKGRIAADGPIEEVLTDQDLLEANDLELPYGFAIPPAGIPGWSGTSRTRSLSRDAEDELTEHVAGLNHLVGDPRL
ncbi:MAG: energy-coupling factor ABC transporter ATP-binding protein [Actinobacteria bacterium]|nr:energy-coupling factor ABC transporter ATP-binding protein [Actinomycetota bacterium]